MWNPWACAKWCPQTRSQGWGRPRFCEGLRCGAGSIGVPGRWEDRQPDKAQQGRAPTMGRAYLGLWWYNVTSPWAAGSYRLPYCCGVAKARARAQMRISFSFTDALCAGRRRCSLGPLASPSGGPASSSLARAWESQALSHILLNPTLLSFHGSLLPQFNFSPKNFILAFK